MILPLDLEGVRSVAGAMRCSIEGDLGGAITLLLPLGLKRAFSAQGELSVVFLKELAAATGRDESEILDGLLAELAAE